MPLHMLKLEELNAIFLHLIVVTMLDLTASLTDDHVALPLRMKAPNLLLHGDRMLVSVSGNPANMHWPDIRVPCLHTPISDVCINHVLNNTMGFASGHFPLSD
jgi:hypothetical protein